MDSVTLVVFLATGFGLGVLHAFDPDHLAALSGLAACSSSKERKTNAENIFSRIPSACTFALRWSVGHGAALSIIAVFVCFVGAAIPTGLSYWFEHCVAYMLIIIGLTAFVSIRFNVKPAMTRYGAICVGLIHGTAGSAPLLALIPLAHTEQPWTSLLYVLTFCIGVTLAMVTIGGSVSKLFRLRAGNRVNITRKLHSVLALLSVTVGVYLLFQ